MAGYFKGIKKHESSLDGEPIDIWTVSHNRMTQPNIPDASNTMMTEDKKE